MSVRGNAIRLPNGALFAIGPRPPQGPAVARAGFSMLVLTADTYQPPITAFPGVCVVRVGVPDNPRSPLSPSEKARVVWASKVAARHLAAGYNALFTCEMGLNRSSMTAALTLVRLGWRRADAVAMVRRMRLGALNNQRFVHIIETEPLSRTG